MTDKAPETGRLEQPRFVRGFDPLTAPRWQPKRTTPWARHIELGRQNPKQWMLVAEIRKGGCKARKEAIERDRRAIAHWVDVHHPLERWQLRVVTVAGTHCDRELYLRFLGVLTPEEDARDRQERRERRMVWQARVIENRERRAAEARQKALEQEAAARIRGQRRRPG